MAIKCRRIGISANPVRDAGTAFLFSEFGFIPFVDTFRGMFHLVKRDDLYWRWIRAGGPHVELVSMDREALRLKLQDVLSGGMTLQDALKSPADVVKRAGYVLLKSPLEALRILSSAFEQATRLAEFSLGVTRGVKGKPASERQAAYGMPKISEP